MTIRAEIVVKNVPSYALDYKYWIVSKVDGEYWFYGAWNDREVANGISLELGKIVLEAQEFLKWQKAR